jgi:integrase
MYLTDRAGHLAVSTLSLHLAAIDHHHLKHGFDRPRAAELRKVWAGIRREHGRPPRKKRALVIGDLQKVVKRLPDTIQGVRDKAVLLVCFAAALRRSELVALHLDDGKSVSAPQRLQFVRDGMVIRLDKSKTDQLGEGQVIAIPHGKTKLCAVAALQAWLKAAAITAGPLFRPIDRHGHVGREALSDRAVADIVKRACRRAGFDEALFSGHSMRAGFVTTAAAANVNAETIMRQTRHKKLDTLRGYIREGELFTRNAASKVGL